MKRQTHSVAPRFLAVCSLACIAACQSIAGLGNKRFGDDETPNQMAEAGRDATQDVQGLDAGDDAVTPHDGPNPASPETGSGGNANPPDSALPDSGNDAPTPDGGNDEPTSDAPDANPCKGTEDGTTCALGLCIRGECAATRCGDGFTDPSNDEECDDGNETTTDGCEDDCKKTRVVDVQGGNDFLCALFDRGTVKCWGSGANGVLGRGNIDPIWEPSSVPPLDFGPGKRVIQLSASYYGACVVFEDRHARCWGYNGHGQLGIGSTESYGDDPGETLSNLADLDLYPVVRIATGTYDTCAVVETARETRTVYCWGNNTRGAHALGNTIPRGHVRPIDWQPARLGGAQVADLIPVWEGMCAHLASGAVRCWGGGDWGTLGNGITAFNVGDGVGASVLPETSDLDVKFAGAFHPVRVTAMHGTVCAYDAAGLVQCWGRTIDGRMGIPTNVANPPPISIPLPQPIDFGPLRFEEVDYAFSSGCGRTFEGAVHCWGYGSSAVHGYAGAVDFRYESVGNAYEKLPNGGAVDIGDFDDDPGIDRAERVFATSGNTCVLTKAGHLRCWGSNKFGQLGLGFAANSSADEAGIGNIGDDETPGQAYARLGVTGIRLF